MSENLWGVIPSTAKISTPNSILLEQGKYLKDATSGLLVGETKRKDVGDKFLVEFYIRVEQLNNYRYHLLKVSHDVHLYPLQLTPSNSATQQCSTEEEFVESLKTILSSSHMKTVIEALLAQAKDEDDEIPF